MMRRGSQLAHLCFLAVCLVACERQQGDISRESASNGSLTFYVDEALTRLAEAEIAAYDSVFPAASLRMVTTTARDAVVKLLSGETKLILLGRPLLQDERDLVAKYSVTLGEYELARSAIAVIVNRRNPVDTMSVDMARAVFEGRVNSWSELGGGRNAGMTRIGMPSPATSTFQNLVGCLNGLNVTSADLVSDTLATLIALVRSELSAIAPVAWSAVSGDTTVKVLRISYRDSTGNPTTPVLLHPAYIHLKRYPLRHNVFGYTTEGHPALAKGFLTFMSNADGQRLALAQSLVPATQIIRLREPE
jgi:ABC-type phosphate transport system substrate-binding protein